MCTKSQNDIMLNLQVFRVCQVLDIEELLYLLHTFLCQIDYLIFFIDNEITGLNDFLTHNGSHLSHLAAGLTTFQLLCQNVTNFIQFGGFTTLAGNNQRGTCLVNQYRVHLINDGVVQFSLYQLFFINNHVITKIIKTILVICHVSNITGILLPSFIVFHGVQNHTDSQPQKLMNLSHPLCITLCQIVIDSYNMNSLSFQRIQICRTSRNKSLTFTGSHLRNTTLMQNNTTDQLYPVMLHIQYSLCSFTNRRKSFRKQIIQSFSFGQPFFKLSGLILQFII